MNEVPHHHHHHPSIHHHYTSPSHLLTCSGPCSATQSFLFLPTNAPYDLSFSLQWQWTGRLSWPNSSKMSHAVLTDRLSMEVCTSSNASPRSRSILPAALYTYIHGKKKGWAKDWLDGKGVPFLVSRLTAGQRFSFLIFLYWPCFFLTCFCQFCICPANKPISLVPCRLPMTHKYDLWIERERPSSIWIWIWPAPSLKTWAQLLFSLLTCYFLLTWCWGICEADAKPPNRLDTWCWVGVGSSRRGGDGW